MSCLNTEKCVYRDCAMTKSCLSCGLWTDDYQGLKEEREYEYLLTLNLGELTGELEPWGLL